MKTRILVAIPIALLVIAAIFVQGWLLAAFAVVLGIGAQFEIVRALSGTKGRPVAVISYVFALLMAILFVADFGMPEEYSMRWLDGWMILACLVAAAIAAFAWAMRSAKYSFESVLTTVFTLVYPQMFVVCYYVMILSATGYSGTRGYALTVLSQLMLFIPPVFSDTLAYFWGRKFGKTRLAPVISPKKTVAGSVAGVVGGLTGAVILWTVFENAGLYRPTFGPVVYACLGAVLAAVSQIGDLAASYLKRSVDLKDFGHLLPGHGGIMDRVDSTMFVMPLVALFVAVGWIGL